mmetsp:Transcript_20884/g.62466  ORF Transcript_20884/g.62466 Transcript_20884/m.62466 type:complete len:277 (-) Transcript_20884:1374-2204(-)
MAAGDTTAQRCHARRTCARHRGDDRCTRQRQRAPLLPGRANCVEPQRLQRMHFCVHMLAAQAPEVVLEFKSVHAALEHACNALGAQRGDEGKHRQHVYRAEHEHQQLASDDKCCLGVALKDAVVRQARQVPVLIRVQVDHAVRTDSNGKSILKENHLKQSQRQREAFEPQVSVRIRVQQRLRVLIPEPLHRILQRHVPLSPEKSFCHVSPPAPMVLVRPRQILDAFMRYLSMTTPVLETLPEFFRELFAIAFLVRPLTLPACLHVNLYFPCLQLGL